MSAAERGGIVKGNCEFMHKHGNADRCFPRACEVCSHLCTSKVA